jgi:hypothetical protein
MLPQKTRRKIVAAILIFLAEVVEEILVIVAPYTQPSMGWSRQPLHSMELPAWK